MSTRYDSQPSVARRETEASKRRRMRIRAGRLWGVTPRGRREPEIFRRQTASLAGREYPFTAVKPAG